MDRFRRATLLPLIACSICALYLLTNTPQESAYDASRAESTPGVATHFPGSGQGIRSLPETHSIDQLPVNVPVTHDLDPSLLGVDYGNLFHNSRSRSVDLYPPGSQSIEAPAKLMVAPIAAAPVDTQDVVLEQEVAGDGGEESDAGLEQRTTETPEERRLARTLEHLVGVLERHVSTIEKHVDAPGDTDSVEIPSPTGMLASSEMDRAKVVEKGVSENEVAEDPSAENQLAEGESEPLSVAQKSRPQSDLVLDPAATVDVKSAEGVAIIDDSATTEQVGPKSIDPAIAHYSNLLMELKGPQLSGRLESGEADAHVTGEPTEASVANDEPRSRADEMASTNTMSPKPFAFDQTRNKLLASHFASTRINAVEDSQRVHRELVPSPAPPVAPPISQPHRQTRIHIPPQILVKAQQHLDYGSSLARRGAIYSAHTEFLKVLFLIARAADASSPGELRTEYLIDGLTALRESEDFSNVAILQGRDTNVHRIAATHHTRVLDANDESWNTIKALQRYFVYAREKMVDAIGGQPIASQALFALGKLHSMTDELQTVEIELAGPKAVAYHEMALLVDPSNYRSANELGVLLARYGQLNAAKNALLQSLAVNQNSNAWRSLANIHRKLGESRLAQLADTEAQIAMNSNLQRQQTGGTIQSGALTWMNPDQFRSTYQEPAVGPIDRTPTRTATAPVAGEAKWWEFWKHF